MKNDGSFAYAFQLCMQAALLCLCLNGCKIPIDFSDDRPRSQKLPLFDPHVTTFPCQIEANHVPPIDAEADAWFRQARALENPVALDEERDYIKIIQLTRQAADRHHWKAMLNLASFYLENRDGSSYPEDAVQLVEQAMQLGIPAAFDRMGIYYLNGRGVRQDVTKAYAFMQRAAQMGNPQAMVFLAEKLNAGPDSVDATHWSNVPIAIKMLECAYSQGYGPAAFALHFVYASPRDATGWITGHKTSETKARALKILHDGVRLGCKDCARMIWGLFDGFDPGDAVVPYIDKARAARYGVPSNELDFNPSARFPNLDKVVPLPPADLPPWNGDRDTLLAAAMGVTLPVTPAKTTMASTRTDIPHPDLHHRPRSSGEQTRADQASVSAQHMHNVKRYPREAI